MQVSVSYTRHWVYLNNRLLYSGCVTSAEEVLIQEQSYSKLIQVLKSVDSCVVITLSPQTVASVAQMIGDSLVSTFVMLSSLLKAIGVRFVLDASAGGDVALVESGHEFLRRCIVCALCNVVLTLYHRILRYNNGRITEWAIPPLSMAVSSTKVSKFNPNDSTSVVEDVSVDAELAARMPLPMLCSHCPGNATKMVCFVVTMFRMPLFVPICRLGVLRGEDNSASSAVH